MRPDSPEDDEALGSMLIAWYMSGYHTGYYLVRPAFVLKCLCSFAAAVFSKKLDREGCFLIYFMISKFKAILYCLSITVLELESHNPVCECSGRCFGCLFPREGSMTYFYSYSETTSSVPEHEWGKSRYVYYSVVFYIFFFVCQWQYHI